MYIYIPHRWSFLSISVQKMPAFVLIGQARNGFAAGLTHKTGWLPAMNTRLQVHS